MAKQDKGIGEFFLFDEKGMQHPNPFATQCIYSLRIHQGKASSEFRSVSNPLI